MHMFNAFIGQDVLLTDIIAESEGYAEKGMRATVASILHVDKHLAESYYDVVLDFSKFDDYNRAFEQANYYDRNGVACLTAREAGFHEVTGHYYINQPDLEKAFIVLDEKKKALFDTYKVEGSDMSYVTWLEAKVMGSLS